MSGSDADVLSNIHSRFDVNTDASVELSPDGYSFFTEIFEKFDIVGII